VDKIDAVVAVRVDDQTAIVAPGSRVRTCAQCAAEVWVAKSTFATFKGKTMPPIWCVPCALLVAEVESLTKRRRPPGRA
jgi:hypothetical protein